MNLTLLYRRPDNTFVAQVNGYPYHVTPSDPLYAQAVSLAAQMGNALPFEPVVEAPATIPSLTARQLRLWLLGHGITRTQVETQINNIPDTVQREAALIEWEYASSYERDHPLINQLGSAFGFTAQEIDEGFIEASQI